MTQVFDKGVASVDKGGPPPTQFTAKGHVIFSRVSLESAFDIKAKAGGRRRGRKPAEETRNREILDEFCKMEANGEVSFDHGGKEAIIRALACCFPGYSPGGIRSIIQPTTI